MMPLTQCYGTHEERGSDVREVIVNIVVNGCTHKHRHRHLQTVVIRGHQMAAPTNIVTATYRQLSLGATRWQHTQISSLPPMDST